MDFYMKDGQFGEQNSSKKPTSILCLVDTLSSLSIASTITESGAPWIQRCDGLASISVASSGAFGVDCSNQLGVDMKSNNKWTRACHCVGGATSITIPSNIVSIGAACFGNAASLQRSHFTPHHLYTRRTRTPSLTRELHRLS